MKIISLNYRNADHEIRSDFVSKFSRIHNTKEFVDRIKSRAPEIEGVVVLSTCNRFELIYSLNRESNIDLDARKLCQVVGIEEDMYCRLFNLYENRGAINHLLRVECGIDSMVLGEDEIFRQTKDAYKKGLEAGHTGKELNRIFQKSFEAVKAVKTKTGISQVPVSVGTLVTNLLYERFDPAKAKILVLGASGKMGGIVIRDLISKNFSGVYGCIRNHGADHRYWSEYPEEMIATEYSDRYELLDEMDAVISATSCPHFTLTYSKVSESLVTDKKRVFIDLAIPSDIEDRISKISGIDLLNIDDFNKLSRNLNEKKKTLAEKVDDELIGWGEEIEREVIVR